MTQNITHSKIAAHIKSSVKSVVKSLAGNSRFWILAFGFALSILIPGIVQASIESTQLQSIRTQQIYSFIALSTLYMAILISPFYNAFQRFPFQSQIKHSRRALGVVTFYFATLHAVVAFFYQLGGFGGLAFLENRYAPSLLLGSFGLLVLAAMALTSTDWAIKKMHFKNWKALHRLVYIGAIAIFIHIIIIGTHYNNDSQLITRITFVALLVLLGLEAWRLDTYIKQRFTKLGNFGIASMLVLHALFLGLGFIIGNNDRGSGFNSNTNNDSSAAALNHGTHMAAKTDGSTATKSTAGYAITLERDIFQLLSLVTTEQEIVFTVTPLIRADQKPECFLINHDDLTYTRGFTTLTNGTEASVITCSPLGDATPPKPGDYDAYVRFTGSTAAVTANVPIRIN